MKPLSLVLAASEAQARRLSPALESAGFAVTPVPPESARPDRLGEITPRVLVLESGGAAPDLSPFWEGREMDAHLPVLLLRPADAEPLPLNEMDEPVDEARLDSDPGEVAARARGLLKEALVRTFRKTFHDMSQPLTIARALSQKALKLSSPALGVDATLRELDRQVERIFRIAEDLHRRRAE